MGSGPTDAKSKETAQSGDTDEGTGDRGGSSGQKDENVTEVCVSLGNGIH